ncbi:hypothetical protein C0992_007845 [Termitomyces sp. T32_za158]|nr:hypothetical protein C0992_007845 [Termitomyces sp. T32_za158]
MSSDSSLGVAFVIGASTKIGRAISLQLAAKSYDIVINDVPEALKSLEALKAKIEKEERKSAIRVIAGNPLIESVWANISAHNGATRGLQLTPSIIQDPLFHHVNLSSIGLGQLSISCSGSLGRKSVQLFSLALEQKAHSRLVEVEPGFSEA